MELSELANRWSLVLDHRERLLRIALARTSNRQDAEDCVQEALIRCVSFNNLDTSRVGPMLTSIVVRLCVDSYRSQQRDSRLRDRLDAPPTSATPEDLVCDKDAGAWAATQLHVLSSRERDVLLSRANGRTVAETAKELGVTYKAVDAAFTRARTRMRMVLKGAVALAGIVWVPRYAGQQTTNTAVTILVCGSLTLGPVMPLGAEPADPGGIHRLTLESNQVSSTAGLTAPASSTDAVAPELPPSPTPLYIPTLANISGSVSLTVDPTDLLSMKIAQEAPSIPDQESSAPEPVRSKSYVAPVNDGRAESEVRARKSRILAVIESSGLSDGVLDR